ncbi:hypothetical protein AN964_05330 [Heyndrickxia shackletonii]|uniref:Glycosyltransferase 2-like domain-containing protein n=3 Tax=Heyndrickxia shackletonii TaxID=157838 RepID=A0A0Q3WQ74_9BACI|nr:hypothetical protein AN964_05330 [Heyndrickxia shackletonii]
MKKHTISLCMIVKNEEKHLEKCLQSVKNCVDELIIVDTGSNDKTLSIAKKFGAKTFFYKWNNDFAEARNFSIQQAKMDYILIMDADEWLDEKVDLQEVLNNEKDYYMVRIKNETSSGIGILHSAIRLFKNNIGLQYFGKIHEHLNIGDESLTLTNDNGNVLLYHVGYKNETYKEKGKHERNLKLLLAEVKRNPSGYNLYNLGNQYKSNKQHSEALEEYKKAFSLSKDKVYVNHLLFNMIDCLRILGQREEALEVVNASIESFPNYTDFYFLRGRIYGEMSYFIDAEKSYWKCIEIGEVKAAQTLEGVGSFLAYNALGDIYLERGDNVKAFEMAIEALKLNKYFLPALRLYMDSLVRTKIPVENIRTNLESIFPVANYNDLKHLIIVLTVVKSPLLQTYLDLYKLSVSESVLGINYLYSKKYIESFKIWKKIDIESEEYKDIILLSFILETNDLLEKCRQFVNLNKKEWKLLDKLIHGKNIELEKASEKFVEIIIFIAEKLIFLGEDDKFNYLLNVIANSDIALKIELSRILLKNGFAQNAQELLLASYSKNHANKDFVELLADTCFKQNQLKEALSFYNRAIELKHDYPTYEKMYRTLEKLNDQVGLLTVKNEIKRLFPLAEWVKSE